MTLGKKLCIEITLIFIVSTYWEEYMCLVHDPVLQETYLVNMLVNYYARVQESNFNNTL